MVMDTEEIREKILKSLSASNHTDLSVDEIAFHMTDWVDDFAGLAAFYENPEKYSEEQVSALLMKYLIHVPAHVAAASKLFLDVPVTDVFDVGAVSEEKN